MTLIRRTNPFGELLSLRSAMDRLFEDSWIRRHDNLLADDQPLALHLSIPKAEVAKPRQIQIKASGITAQTPQPEVVDGSSTEQGS